jgi:hypothetical protein
MDGSKEVERREANHGTSAETIQDALSEARQEAQERREAVAEAQAPDAQRARERARAADQATPRESTQVRVESPRKPRAPHPKMAALRRHWDHLRRPAMVGMGVLGLLVLLWAIFAWEKTITAEVEHRSWERSQEIERFVQLSDSSWCDDRPGDAYDVDESRRQRGTRTVIDCRDCDCHTEQVKVGENCYEANCRTVRTDNGNGSFDVTEVCDRRCDPVHEDRQICKDRTHEESVYDEWCSYRMDRWRPHRTASEEGNFSRAPAWPELDLRTCGRIEFGCERPGARKENYVVSFRDVQDDEHYECSYPQSAWTRYEEGSLWKATVKRLGGRFQCASLVAMASETEI